MIHEQKPLWIMKPTSKCQGKGIFIISKINEIAKWKNRVTPENEVVNILLNRLNHILFKNIL